METDFAKKYVTAEETLHPAGIFCLNEFHTRDFRLPPRCRADLYSSGILRGVEW
jgi:hypothetical protein